MKLFETITRPPWRTLYILIVFAGLSALGYYMWTPGSTVLNGSHDLESNGIRLQEMRREVPAGKVFSIAAYPPPTILQQTLDVHREKPYYAKVAREVDQMVIMMYDTSLRFQKLYQHLMASWTR
jgi:hypothetical protein